ncbi:hypothetical protein ElyMa_002838000 [Elysia marginata]|uniref:Uncharacterized protein n=1 Tax=Elysia marginata TaxID=1093978 RepID=A0AAV4HV14_9GAST|nr:hypothetical protein ElyMa_002838000 [Elysia marginata]
MNWSGIEPTTYRSQVRRSNHSVTQPLVCTYLPTKYSELWRNVTTPVTVTPRLHCPWLCDRPAGRRSPLKTQVLGLLTVPIIIQVAASTQACDTPRLRLPTACSTRPVLPFFLIVLDL